MNIETKFAPAYTLAVVTLQPGEALRVESGAMVDMDSNLSMETGVRSSGGILKGLARMFAGESFFQNTFRAATAQIDPSSSLTSLLALPTANTTTRMESAIGHVGCR